MSGLTDIIVKAVSQGIELHFGPFSHTNRAIEIEARSTRGRVYVIKHFVGAERLDGATAIDHIALCVAAMVAAVENRAASNWPAGTMHMDRDGHIFDAGRTLMTRAECLEAMGQIDLPPPIRMTRAEVDRQMTARHEEVCRVIFDDPNQFPPGEGPGESTPADEHARMMAFFKSDAHGEPTVQDVQRRPQAPSPP